MLLWLSTNMTIGLLLKIWSFEYNDLNQIIFPTPSFNDWYFSYVFESTTIGCNLLLHIINVAQNLKIIPNVDYWISKSLAQSTSTYLVRLIILSCLSKIPCLVIPLIYRKKKITIFKCVSWGVNMNLASVLTTYAMSSLMCVKKMKLWTSCWNYVELTFLNYMLEQSWTPSFIGVFIRWQFDMLNRHEFQSNVQWCGT
jgi:hypothetical protein